MIRLFKHYIPHAVLLLAFLDFVLLLGAAEAGWIFRAHQIGMAVEPLPTRYIPLVSFALSLQVAMIAVGVYGTEALQSLRFATARLLVAISLARESVVEGKSVSVRVDLGGIRLIRTKTITY